MLGELVLRFILGGTIVSAFAAFGEMGQPKTFAGIFGAAPSVALASLSLAYLQHGSAYFATETRSMQIGALACVTYAVACVAVARRQALSIALGAVLAWSIWFLAAFALFFALRAMAVLQ